jgi:predicted Zn finger-like uncharacterized protein
VPHRAEPATRGMLGTTPSPAAWMIVTCPQCQTRFRIPDDKVTPKGVKVRCTRCRHTFRVSRPADPPVETPEDPFAQFAPPDALSEKDKTPQRGTPVGVEVEPAGAPPADDFDVDVDAPEARRSPPLPVARSEWTFPPPPTAEVAIPVPPPPPAPEPLDVPTPRVALARISTVRQVARVVADAEPENEAALLEESASDKLELDTGSPHSAWQGSTEGGFELPTAASAELDFGDLDLEGPSTPMGQPPPAPRGALDFDTMESHSMPAGKLPPVLAPVTPGGFDVPPTPVPRPATPEGPVLDFGELDLAPPVATPIPRAPAAEARTPTAELFGRSATALDEEPFPGGPGATDSTAADRAVLFEMPAPELPPSAGPEDAPRSLLADVPDALPDAPPPPRTVPTEPATPLGRVSRPPTGTKVLGLEERREFGRAWRLSGAVVNIGVAAVLVVVLAAVGNVYVNEGRLDWGALSPRRWATLFVPPRGIVTLDVSNGLYETRGARPLAYVRGRVENRGDRAGQVRVRAEIWEGSQLLGTSEGLAGVLPTPEEMVEASTRRDVEALRARLMQGAPVVAPGKGTDFVLLFDEPPAEVAGLRLKVSAAAVDGR